MKTIAQKHAMRGSCALLVHLVNDYLIKELPKIRDSITLDETAKENIPILGWEADSYFKNHGNVRIQEYMDDNEYFNIDPTRDVRFTERTNERYWEKLEGLGYDDSLGVLTKRQIYEFYKNTLGMGRLQPTKPKDYDYIQDFLVDLFKIGANPIEWRSDEGEFYNPIDDIINKSEEDYGYTKQERLEVQQNTQLRRNQQIQFNEYSGNRSIVGRGLYDYVNNQIFYWKNMDYSSHVLHPFMYNLKLWNRLDNIIINGYKDYVNNDLIDYLSSKVKFDEIFGEFGEGRNFWKYNIMDLTGYTTRYESAVKDEHLDDENKTISPLTGYDGLFYPDAAQEFVDMMKDSTMADSFTLDDDFFNHEIKAFDANHLLLAAVYSIYWQDETTTVVFSSDDGQTSTKVQSFYTKWYSHLNYKGTEYQKIAMQLWYWRDRICELIKTAYPIKKYCLDIQGNSLILVQTFRDKAQETNPFLIDLTISQSKVQSTICENHNEHVSFCENRLSIPSELWIRWKSNPIALPALDAWYDRETGFPGFDSRYRQYGELHEMGQLTHTNGDCNDLFKVVLKKWMARYGKLEIANKLPVFFDMEQSANVLALASWSVQRRDGNEDGIVEVDDDDDDNIVCCGKNPIHILSIERTSQNPSEYNLTRYSTDDQMTYSAREWLFDAYHYCHVDGSILVPMYNFKCNDENGVECQKARIRMFIVSAQQLKNQYNVATGRIVALEDMELDLNRKVDFDEECAKYAFDAPVKVCRNTNMVFSAYDNEGQNKVRCAFLGQFDVPFNDGSFKVNSCQAKTRYEFDSQNVRNLALIKSRYHKGDNDSWSTAPGRGKQRRYLDNIVGDNFNSYDSLDKHVFVIDFNTSIDSKGVFDMGWMSGISTSSYNILGDAGCIPHFAYQSLLKYADKDGGISYTFRNEHFKGKTHIQFELLGLDDQSIPDVYNTMQKMVVDDLTDDCKTILCPARMMDDIYRIWCENETFYANPSDPYDSYFSNEYKQWSNPMIDFNGEDDVHVDENGNSFVEKSPEDSDLLEIEVKDGEELRDVLGEYYIQIVRTDGGTILNEKRYLLQPSKVSDFIIDVEDADGYRRCALSKWQSSAIQDKRKCCSLERPIHSTTMRRGSAYTPDQRNSNMATR